MEEIMDYELLTERYQLACMRIKKIKQETFPVPEFQDYFRNMATFLKMVNDTYQAHQAGWHKNASLEELKKENHALYQDILEENYGKSYANPTFASKKLGEEFGQLLCFLYSELRSMITFAFEEKLMDLTIRAELFLEIYGTFVYQWEESKTLPKKEDIRQIIYWYVSDYNDIATEVKISERLIPQNSFAFPLVMESDLTDVRYLFWFGEYVTEYDIRLAKFMNNLPEEKVELMANTFTEGYRIGFITGNKDITKKKTVGFYYSLGFERMLRKAVSNFKKMGLDSILFRSPANALEGRSINKNGYYGSVPNRQYEYDHDEDQALYLDKQYINRKLEVLRMAYEKNRDMAAVYGGPAVIDIFGETPFSPEFKKEACHLSEEQQKLSVEFSMAAGELVNEYIKGEERSFTIIAFPMPQIGDNFEEIFDEIIKINTLDYTLYQKIQQTIIDTLDLADTVIIKGMNGNHTELRVKLHPLSNPDKESNFENCVADVNIPVGEVFTSPQLMGTNGVLHVKRVFLNDLEYRNISITFTNGMISDYSCSNFETEAENKKYIKDNVLFHHDSLPMGEFAIGTNTTAYMIAQKYQIGDKLPILIAEKMGPHFAVGDTCYSHAEDVAVFNPDGKELVARDNEVSLLRKTDKSKAYFNCHTDVTIPYDELGSITVWTKEGKEIPIIESGRFVLPGCDELNKAFED